MLQFEQVKKTYGEVAVLRDVSFALAPGETLALTGESGSGKSTILHIAAGLEPFDSGSVRAFDRQLERCDEAALAGMRRSDVALVFQQFNLVPSLTVGANIAFHARLAGRCDDALVARLAARLGLEAQLHKYPEALSGGQQQRAAIARALAMRPRLLLADEPTGNLDEATADRVMAEMRDLVAETGAALMVVTHSQKVASGLMRQLHLSGGVLA